MKIWPQSGKSATALLGLGCLILLLSQKALTGLGVWHTVSIALSMLFIVWSLIHRALYRDNDSLRAGNKLLLLCHGTVCLAIAMYAVQTPWGRELLSADVPTAGQKDPYGAFFGVLWPILFLIGALPVLMLELAIAPMRRAQVADARRLSGALRTGLTAALAISFVFVGNYLATKHDIHRDLAYFQTTRAGTATINRVKHLEEDVDVTLFYPRANDVLEQVHQYMESLAAHSNHFKVKVVDRLMDPALARRHRVRENGSIVVSRGNKRQTIKISTEFNKARRKLAKLDADFLKELTKVTAPKRVAYLVVGHDELTEKLRIDGNATRSGDKLLREVLSYMGYQIKTLSASNGLTTQVPEDASVLLMIGPRKPLLPGEAKTITQWITQDGGRLLVALEPDGAQNLEKLLAPLGLVFQNQLVAHERYHLRTTFDSSERYAIATSSFSSHASIKTLARNDKQIAVVFREAGSLQKTSKPVTTSTIDFTIRSMRDSWADTNRNHQFDKKTEARQVFNMAAAVAVAAPEKHTEEGRVIVVADSDTFSDQLMRYRGNLFLLTDSLRYLASEEKLAGTIESEEDKPVEHTQDDDIVWFYGSVIIMPMAVLLGGLGYVRRRRRKHT